MSTAPHLDPRMSCHWCWRDRSIRVPAIIRVFSGMMAGEGFPACEAHRSVAEVRALEPLARPDLLAADYRVIAFEVVLSDDGAYYKLGRKLWQASPKRSA